MINNNFRGSIFNGASLAILFVASILTFAVPVNAGAQKDVRAQIVTRKDRKAPPSFHLVSATGESRQLTDYRGKVVLLNFWATKCGGCILEIPSFIELQKTYGMGRFTAVGISADIPYLGLRNADEAWQKVRPFMASHGINYPILMGNGALVDAFGFESYPATYLIDGNGRIAAIYVGVVNRTDVEANIKTLLAER